MIFWIFIAFTRIIDNLYYFPNNTKNITLGLAFYNPKSDASIYLVLYPVFFIIELLVVFIDSGNV